MALLTWLRALGGGKKALPSPVAPRSRVAPGPRAVRPGTTFRRLYDHGAPPAQWVDRREPCPRCRGTGVLVNPTGTGVDPCPGAALKAGGPVYPCTGGTLHFKAPPVRGIQCLSARQHQHFTPALVEGGQGEGWLAVRDNRLIISTTTILPGGRERIDPLVYRILRAPGYYCCHCEKTVADAPTAQLHVETQHAGARSPDPANPAGYRRDNFYDCEREE